MTANENFEKKREDARVMVISGVVLMSIGIIALFCVYYMLLISELQGRKLPYSPEIGIIAFYIGICTGTVGLVGGFLLLLLGLLVGLIGQRKKRKSH